MCSVEFMIGMSAVTGLLSGVAEANAQRQAVDAQNRANALNAAQASQNADYARSQEKDALERGYDNASEERKTNKRLIASNHASAGASGVNPNVGSPAQTLVDDAREGESNVQTILSNSRREANSYAMKANNYDNQATAYLSQNRSAPSAIPSLINGLSPAIDALVGIA